MCGGSEGGNCVTIAAQRVLGGDISADLISFSYNIDQFSFWYKILVDALLTACYLNCRYQIFVASCVRRDQNGATPDNERKVPSVQKKPPRSFYDLL